MVVGLNRTGKSCRLRWVNYLHPGLKRGKMTPQEERLVLELHAKWGNRSDPSSKKETKRWLLESQVIVVTSIDTQKISIYIYAGGLK